MIVLSRGVWAERRGLMHHAWAESPEGGLRWFYGATPREAQRKAVHAHRRGARP